MAEENKTKQPSTTSQQYLQQINELPDFNYNQFYKDWKSGGKPVVEAILSNYRKPEPKLTPEQEKRVKTASAITDSFTTLAELFAHGQGARVRNRQGKTNMQTTNERLKQIEDKYLQDSLRYGTAKSNAEMQDFAQQLKAAMQTRGEKRNNIILRAEYAKALEEESRKNRQTAADEERKRNNARTDELWTFENITKPTLAERDKYDSRSVSRRAYTDRQESKQAKDLFEIPISEGTEGAVYDPYTGRSYISREIAPERQATILANLPGGKQQYIIQNKLYKTYNYKDEVGNTREQVVPFSDSEIIKHYLENDYFQRQGRQQEKSKPSQPIPTPSWKVYNGYQPKVRENNNSKSVTKGNVR
jgi:hypothetical protein